MAVSEDGSTPAVVTVGGGSTATTLATASFAPPAGSLLVAECVVNWNTAPGQQTLSMADTGGGTWIPGPVVYTGASFSQVQIFTRPCPSAPGRSRPRLPAPGRARRC